MRRNEMLEELIVRAKNSREYAYKMYQRADSFAACWTYRDAMLEHQKRIGELADFVLAHADTFIAWEREHAPRISPSED